MFLKRVQLGLVHVAVAITLVPFTSVLNRIMINELAISATLVALLTSLPYLFSPIQVAIGSFSDRYPVFGYRRSPYILLGLLLCVTGVIFAPEAAFLISTNWWAGILLAALTFGGWGMGYNFASVSYFSLASEISGEKERSRTVAVMFFMMILSIIFTAIGLSQLLEVYTPATLERSFWVVAIVALVLGVLGLVGLEKRSGQVDRKAAEQAGLGSRVRMLVENHQAARFFFYLVLMLAAILGQDVVLEPFAARAFDLSVQATTRISSIWGACVLVTILVEYFLERRLSKRTVVKIGGWGAVLAFILLAASGVTLQKDIFYLGVVVLGLATGLATISNLSLMLDMTIAGKVGLFMGAWGMANAFSRLTGSLISGVVRDLVAQLSQNVILGYVVVFAIEAAMLILSLLLLRSIDVRLFRRKAESELSVVEKAAAASDA
jgi:BCD family chlorophyll transporter-like MFS transporter